MRMVPRIVCAVTATVSVAACADYDSATNLAPEGPPMIVQVRLTERYMPLNSTFFAERNVFGFGSHPMALDAEMHPVTSAKADANKLRVITDELLVGNNLEEIACRGPIDSDAYSRVPRGATPDDIAKCSAAQDVLPATCKGEFAVCICQNAGGCLPDGAMEMVAMGEPVGVLDINQDGAADDTHLIAGAVGIRCGSIDVDIDPDTSYWNPSGNQQVPAQGGFDALGPAIVVQPRAARGLPTNLECQLTFSSEIVDKQGEAICAPSAGDPANGCTPGDVSAFTFTTVPLDFDLTGFADGMTGVSRLDPIDLAANVPLDPATINGITLTPAPGGAVTVTLANLKELKVTIAGGLAASTEYTLTIPTTVHDTYGQGAPAAKVFTFTTGN